MIDPVLDTLVLPLTDGSVAWPEDGAVQFLRARYGDALDDLPRALVCEQSFKPAHDTLKRAGFPLRAGDEGETCALTLLLPPRQREEQRALLARAVTSTRPGGIVLAAVSNLEGARTVEGDLKALAGNITSLSKNKCRAFWATIDPERCDYALIEAWEQLDTPRPIDAVSSTGLSFISRPGLFAWDHLDAGSKLLADNLPAALTGRAADLGAGFGYLSAEALGRYPGITHLDVIEAEKRALEMARQNLAGFGDRAVFHWLDATGPLPDTYDVVLSNPPFHIDRADRHDIGKAFIVSAARALKPGGQFWMVANRHLPYEETLNAAFKTVNVVAENGYFKVFRAIGVKGGGPKKA
jgi:16S rRNA (guanine1207-N2)-methyltransferase